ncbi:MAG TPA: recombinase family protein [Anaerolineae bacterium]
MAKAKQATHGAVKRAAIYVRVSSEGQAKDKNGRNGEDEAKTSPDAQERDCRALCERQGYQVVAVFRDTAKYRVGKRLVEPSGTRADRPGLRAILAVARAGEVDVIVAWREDRLYRSYRPMLDVLDCLDETGIDIELAKETFDKRIAPVKAWAAKMELDAKADRFMMGVSGRFAKGKDWNGHTPYGCSNDNGTYRIKDDEARAVRLVWSMFGDGETLPTIRDRLIGEGAPQRNTSKHVWAVSQIYRILKRDYYWTGAIERTWDGETYQVQIPAIVDEARAARVKERFARFKSYPSGNLKAQALGAGLVRCEHCDCIMQVIRYNNGYKDYTYYRCPSKQLVGKYPRDCARSAQVGILDAEIWRKTWEFISDAERLRAEVDKQIAVLQQQKAEAEGEVERLTKELDGLAMERQWVITRTRKGSITEADMEMQLAALTFQEAALRADLTKAERLSGNRAERMRKLADDFTRDVEVGRELVELEQAAPERLTPEQVEDLFNFKHGAMREVVKRIDVQADKTPKVHIEIRLDDDDEVYQVGDGRTGWLVTDPIYAIAVTL